ncbi:MAG: type IV secretion system DNA-binding domain-containing protein, partial [Patescibacteria group bacterium]
AGSCRQFALPHTNAFRMLSPRVSETLPLGFTVHPYVLSVEEIATLWHLPTAMVQTPNIDWVLSKKLEPPIHLPVPPSSDLTLLGEAVFRGSRTAFGIKTDDRRRHIYVIGKTGMGKSTLLENMLFSDFHAGRGIGLIDPHGDLVEAVLKFIPKERSNDVILFDPSDKDFPISFNILECRDRDQQPLVASGIMSVFTKLWPDVWSGRMEHILRNTLLALLQTEGSSMLGIMRMFADDSYRGKVVSRLSDPLVRSFWEDEYASWSEKYRTEAIAAIQNKVGQLLSTPLIRNIIGQVTSTVDIRHAMDTGKIILVNLSKGKLGEDTSAFLGSMLVTKFQLEAMSRADIPENDRRDFFLYVDEFQNFATESFATILSEARKYRLSLTMANQYVAQLLIGDKSTKLQDAVFGNVGTMVSFQVGSDDAEELSKQFEEMVVEKDILSLPKYHAYLRLMIDGIPSKPFSVSTLPPPVFEQDLNRVEIIRKLSRERYSEKRQVVEEKIKRWAESAKEGKTAVKSAEKAKDKEEEEKKKAREKKMTLDEYRKWRDKEMWTNDFNALRKRSMLGEALTPEDNAKMKDLEKKLEASGGVPAPSKTLLAEVEKKNKGVGGGA